MKSTCTLRLVLLLFVSVSAVAEYASPDYRTDGRLSCPLRQSRSRKGAEEGEGLKNKAPNAPMPGHYIVLRHQDGEDWDYAVIEHLGTKATVDAAGNPSAFAVRDLSAWHGDTFVERPAWPEFAKAMGLDDAAKSAGSVYVVSVFRAAPGHRDELEKSLAQPPGSGDTHGRKRTDAASRGWTLEFPHHFPL